MSVLSYESKVPATLEVPPPSIRVVGVLNILLGIAMLSFHLLFMSGFGLARWGGVGLFIATWETVMIVAPLMGGIALQCRRRRAVRVGTISFVALAVAEAIVLVYGLLCCTSTLFGGGGHGVMMFGLFVALLSSGLLCVTASVLRHLRELRPCQTATAG